ncbi:TPA: hypothetical protein L7K58_005323, partial [Klebsiella pneumoniae]|nr:hypothetical protein [Klebsiella pneumoniae]
QKMTGGKLVVYLTYDQLNAQNSPLFDSYDIKVKAYGSGIYKLLRYKNPRKKSNTNFTTLTHCRDYLNMSDKEKQKILEESRKSHLFEVKNLIKDYILCNDFDMFWTLTFDPKRCVEAIEDEYRFKEFGKWLQKMRMRHKRKSDKPFNYIAIPERHKSGQIHWHMVTGNLDPNLVDSGKTFRNQKIYNCTDWEHGFTNVQKMRSKSKVSSYVTKYITKGLLYSPVRKHKKKYFCSKGLALPEVYAGTFEELKYILPVCDKYGALNPSHSNDVCDIWLFKAGVNWEKA